MPTSYHFKEKVAASFMEDMIQGKYDDTAYGQMVNSAERGLAKLRGRNKEGLTGAQMEQIRAHRRGLPGASKGTMFSEAKRGATKGPMNIEEALNAAKSSVGTEGPMARLKRLMSGGASSSEMRDEIKRNLPADSPFKGVKDTMKPAQRSYSATDYFDALFGKGK